MKLIHLNEIYSLHPFNLFEDHVLSGHALSTHQVYSLPECHTLCLEHPRCLSYNFQKTSISSRSLCEINDATDKMCPQDLVREIGYKYYEDKVIYRLKPFKFF